MGKDSASRRAWVKNVAIIFLVILLLLTFFSGTIMNYSLPEVSAQYTRYGSISTAVKLSGTVKANENYHVIYEEEATEEGGTPQTRTITSVYVKVGDTVAIGDPIIALKGGASAELKAAKEELEKLEREYEDAVLDDKDKALTTNQDAADLERAVESAKKELAKAQSELNKLYERYNKALKGEDPRTILEAQIKELDGQIKTVTKEKDTLENKTKKALTDKIAEINTAISDAKGKIETDYSGLTLEERYTAAKTEFDALSESYERLKKEVDDAKAVLDQVKSSSGDLGRAYEISKTIKTLNDTLNDLLLKRDRMIEDWYHDATLEDLQDAVNDAQKRLNDYLTAIGASSGTGSGSGSGTDSEKDAGSDPETGAQSAANGSETTAPETAPDYMREMLEWQLKQAQDALAAYKDELASKDNTYSRDLEDLDRQIDDAKSDLADEYEKLSILGLPYIDSVVDYAVTYDLETAQNAYDEANESLTEVSGKYDEAKKTLDSLTTQTQSASVIEENEALLAVYEPELEALEEEIEKLDEQIEELNDQKSDLSEELAGESGPEDPEEILDQIDEKKNDVSSKETEVTKAEENLKINKERNNISAEKTENSREDQRKAIDKLKETIKTYENAPETTDVTAPIAGRIASVDFVPGNSITSGATVAQIEVSERGYVCEISVESEQARRIQVGASCTISNSWWYSNLEATVTQIRSDPQTQGRNRIVVIEVKGDVYDGQTLQFSIGDNSQSYDAVLPNSAIREDSDGTFVLAVESKSTPLGTRYKAVRYDVEVIASDETQSAVSGLYGSEFIIINATSPVSDGQSVRLAGD